MIQGDFYRPEGSEAERPSGGQFRFVVEAFDDARGNRAFGAEPIKKELAMIPQHAGDLLHRLEPRAQCRVPRSSVVVFSGFFVASRRGEESSPGFFRMAVESGTGWVLALGLSFSSCFYSVDLRAQELAIHRLKPTRTFLKRSAGRLL